MSRPWRIRFLSCALLLGTLCVGAQAQQRGTASHLQPAHREVVQQWLAQKPALRLAVDGDYLDKSDLKAQRAGFENYHPYYAVADFNGDKRDDFAIALVNTQKRIAKFAIAIFNGPVRKESAPAFFREGYNMSRQAFSLAEGIEDARRTTLFVENPGTEKGLVLRVGRKGYSFVPFKTDFN
jgi:hypothetical protein